MNSEAIWDIAEVIESTFAILEMSGNKPNYLFIGVGFVFIFYWIRRQIAYNKQAEATGGQK